MKTKIISILQDIRPEFDFSSNVNFVEEGMLDSFDVVLLVNTLDEKFNISIDGADIRPENFSSVERIEELLKRKGVQINESGI
jgi:acyl carrier protein